MTPIIVLHTFQLYKLFNYTSILWVILPQFPLLLFYSLAYNVNDNLRSNVSKIYLMRNGTHVVVSDMLSKEKTHPIETLSKPSDKNLIDMRK